MSKTAKVEMKLRLDQGLKAQLESEARTATGKLGRTVSLNEYAVAILRDVVTGKYDAARRRTAKEK